MNLSRKTLLYTSIISVIIVVLLVGYFIFMLPSLYVAYMQDRNLDSIVELQRGYRKTGSYQIVEAKNPGATISIKVPLTGRLFYIESKLFHITAKVTDPKLQEWLDKLRAYAQNSDNIEDLEVPDFDFDEFKDTLFENINFNEEYPLQFEFELYEEGNIYQELSSKVHMISGNLIVYEANVTDGNSYYTSYMALEMTEDALVITFMPVMTPRIEEIKPVVFRSLPMIVSVALLLILLSSQIFSKGIIVPVIKLARHAEYMKEARDLKLEPIEMKGQDEISSLGESLNGLYQKIQDSYRKLEEKNQDLYEENKRQEIFLRASSHQLKTPITAALLLVQGMIGEVGKYKETRQYLPQVKQQLLSMQRIVEDLLYLNHCSRNLQPEPIPLLQLLQECLDSYQIQIEQKELDIMVEGSDTEINTDRELLKKIIDNLLSNAVCFTPEGKKITLFYNEYGLTIINYGIMIEKEVLPHIFEPFVTSGAGNSHGLGLYVASYYAKLLHCRLTLQNLSDGVMAELQFMK